MHYMKEDKIAKYAICNNQHSMNLCDITQS